MKISLLGIPIKRKLLWLAPGFFFVNAVVVLSSSFSTRSSILLSPSSLDLAIPYLPWMIFFYLAHFPFAFFALYGLKDAENFNRTTASILLVTLVTAPIFVFAPTELHPFTYPVPAGWAGILLSYTNHVNARLHNACPSMHAGYALLAALGYRDEQRGLYLPAMACAFLIALSTLLAKQHYLLDVLAGWAVSWACRAVVDRCVEFRFADPHRAHSPIPRPSGEGLL